MSWRSRAKCAGGDPRIFDLDHLRRTVAGLTDEQADAIARDLCSGCPVMEECTRDSSVPIDMTAVLDTGELPDVVEQSEVIRGGKVLRYVEEKTKTGPGEHRAAKWARLGLVGNCIGCRRRLRGRHDPYTPGTIVRDVGNWCRSCRKRGGDNAKDRTKQENY
ncbi:WhiB family transcriptional regulator [Nocardia sp. CS682]|uniref:WhiB family transcriptional regulator n=1 Tax=Nocardia sp. CS682 TaxID=1047172 RepID=UPI00142F6863|nr:WhiB family transcriptional regulator [Nocardia sp. CS682]